MDDDVGHRLDKVRKRIEKLKDQLTDAETERDELIIEARSTGATLRAVADRAGVSHTWVMKLGRGRDE